MDATVISFRGGVSRFRLDLHAGQLWQHPATHIPLPAKQFDLLRVFVTHPKKLFSKDDLISEVWGALDVTDEALAQAVRGLRQALGDDKNAPRFIATVPKKGYRFDAEVDGDASSPWKMTAVSAPSLVHAAPATEMPREARFQAWRFNVDSTFALTPVCEETRLVGRQFELSVGRDQLMVPGQHVLLYGPLGAGKTSLANVLAMTLARDKSIVWCKTDVNALDTFKEISRKIRSDIGHAVGIPDLGAGRELTSSELAQQFTDIARHYPFVMILDEFQRPMAHEAAVGISELLKGLGDRRARAQFVVVGIAENIRDLIEGHESLVMRHLLPIRVGTMTRPTTLEIVRRGFSDLAEHGWPDRTSSQGMGTIAESITVLSLGLPTMVNDLARETARVALDNRSTRLTEADFENALSRLTSRYSQELDIDLRQLAHDKYLVACAAARTDTRGSRTVRGVADALEKLTGDPIEEADIASRLAIHLKTGFLKHAANEMELQFALNLLPSRLLVAAAAARSLKLDRLALLWRHPIDRILDELEYQMFECLRLADIGSVDSAREIYRQADARLKFAIEHVKGDASYPAQRDRLLSLEARFPDLRRMIDLGEPPTVG